MATTVLLHQLAVLGSMAAAATGSGSSGDRQAGQLGAAEPSSSPESLGNAGTEPIGTEPDDSQPSDGEAAGTGSNGTESTGEQPDRTDDQPARSKTKWIHRHAPTRHMGEIGLFGGVFLPTPRLELFQADASRPEQGYRKYRSASFELGARAGYYPLRFFGAELEGAVMPTRLADGGSPRANVYALRGHFVGQLGLWSVTPFVVLGTGALGVSSDRSAVGRDVDVSIHFGGGVKIFATDYLLVRLDLRDTVSARRGVDTGVGHSGELLLGVSYTPRKRTKPKGPKDTDKDGFLDDEDRCPKTPGIAPDGCPRRDRDGDGFYDDEDRCPDVPGVEPDGCPRPDRDGDKIPDAQDACPDEPEVKNGFEDADGCPDELPKEVADFVAKIQGIEFDTDRDTIKPGSRPILDHAVEVLTAQPQIAVEIGGHTDSTGSRDHNLDLSRRRAQSVRTYLIEHGIAPERLSTRGYGPDRPVDTNDTKEGRARNRRIEFTVRQD